MKEKKIDKLIFIIGMISLIINFIFDVPERIGKAFIVFAITCAVVFASYFASLSLVIGFDVEEGGKFHWFLVGGISFWIGVWTAIKDLQNNDDSLSSNLKGLIKEIFDLSEFRRKYNNLKSESRQKNTEQNRE